VTDASEAAHFCHLSCKSEGVRFAFRDRLQPRTRMTAQEHRMRLRFLNADQARQGADGASEGLIFVNEMRSRE
jgi:hypothetical protein